MTYQNIFYHQDIVTVSVITPVPNLPSSQNHQQLYGIAILQGKKNPNPYAYAYAF